MCEEWKAQAVVIGKIIHSLAGKHRELIPLKSCFINFSRKYSVGVDSQAAAAPSRGTVIKGNLRLVKTDLPAYNPNEFVVVNREDYENLVKSVASQSEVIDALELRVNRLMESL